MNNQIDTLWGEIISILVLCLLALKELFPVIIKRLRNDLEKTDKKQASDKAVREINRAGQAFFEDLAKQHIVDLKQTRTNAERKLQENDGQIKELAENLKKIELEREGLRIQVELSADEIKELRALVRTTTEENLSIRKQQASSLELIESLSEKVDALRTELDQAKLALEITKTQAQATQAQLLITQKEVQRLEELLKEERDRSQTLNDMLQETKKELTEARKHLDEEKDENKSLRETIFDLKLDRKQ